VSDRATPNLPSSDFNRTEGFYSRLGFKRRWRDEGWMILERGSVTIEFFHDPAVDPATSRFSCCLRLDGLDAFFAQCQAAGIPQQRTGWPRIHAPQTESWGGRVGALIDPDGTLLRLIQN
jgi:catechol 2,3-dioxygenase-like lactoylglutathione lyase family enzyme